MIYGILCCAVVTACAGRSAERRLLSENATWRVWASGESSQAGSLLGDAVVWFSVEQSGREFAGGELYRAGGNDRPFDRQFSDHDWVSPNALRLFTPPAQQILLTTVRIENSAQLPLGWLLLQASEIILALDIRPDQSIEVPLMQLSDLHRFTLRGQFGDGTRFENSHSLSVPSDATLTVRVSAAGTTVEDR